MFHLRNRELNGWKRDSANDKKWKAMWKDELFLDFQHFQNKVLFTDRLGTSIPPYACDFSTVEGQTDNCLVVDEEGYVSVVDTNPSHLLNDMPSTLPLKEKWLAHNNAVFDVKWIPQSNHFVTASGDTTAALWDVSNPETKLTSFVGHSCSLKSVSVSKNNPNILATGSRDGNILLWDSRCRGRQNSKQQPVGRIQNAHVVYDSLTPQRKRKRYFQESNNQLLCDSRQTVTSVIFQNSNTLVSSGAMDGTIKMWDIRKTSSGFHRKKTTSNSASLVEGILYPGESDRRRGYNCLCLDSTGTKLFASCTDNIIYEYDLSHGISSRKPSKKYSGHYSSSFYVRIAVSPDDLHILSGCDDNMAYIWNLTSGDSETTIRPSHCLESNGMQQVTSVAWCPADLARIATCSDDAALRIWNVPFKKSSNNKRDGFCRKMKEEKNNSPKTDELVSQRIGFFQSEINPQKRVKPMAFVEELKDFADNIIPASSNSPKSKTLKQQSIFQSFVIKGSKTLLKTGHKSSKNSNPLNDSENKENCCSVVNSTELGENPEIIAKQTVANWQQPTSVLKGVKTPVPLKQETKSYTIKSYFNVASKQ
uniref:Denticleless protein homolog n=1 Tax=Phallusia mammillata TaxID=59560 RepID=A0A6F9DBK5_9ASCI|nr:denticleless protein homolog [Phallusia mammillata]